MLRAIPDSATELIISNTRKMKFQKVYIQRWILLLILIFVSKIEGITQMQTVNATKIKYTPSSNLKWNMFGPVRIHIQDFAVTDKYTDTASGKVDGRFLDLANLNYGVGFYQNFSKKLAMSAELMFGYGYISKKSATADDKLKTWSQTIRADLYYHFYNNVMQLQPFLFVGMHGTYKMGNIYVSTPVGLGAKYMFFNNNAMITTQVGYGIGLTNGIRNSVIYSTGFYLNMKRNK